MRNNKVEQELKLMGLEFEFVKDYPINKIDWKEAEANPARLTAALDLDLVVSYALKMEAGADWEAITVRDLGGPLDHLINGRHTCAAMSLCKPQRTTIDAMVVRHHDPYLIEMAIRTSNILNGRSTTHQEKLMHVAEMRRIWPHATIKDLAAHFAMKTATVGEYLKAIAAEGRAETLGVGSVVRSRAFSGEMKRDLNTLQVDQVFIRAAQLIAKFPLELRGHGGSEFIASLRDAGNERRALKLIDDRDRELARAEEQRKAKKPRMKPTRSTQFLGDYARWLRQWPGSVEKVYLEGYSWRQLERYVQIWDQGSDILTDLRDKAVPLIEEMKQLEEWATRRTGSPESDRTSPTA